MGYFEEHPEKYLLSPGTTLCQIFGDKENASASVALVKMEAGSKGVLHYHDNITEIYFFSKENGIININGHEHEVAAGDCYVIPSNNTHFVDARNNMNFVCVCTPPWIPEHEFIVDNFINENDYNKVPNYGVIYENELLRVEYNLLEKEEVINKVVEANKREVYYFAKGCGTLTIDETEYEIHEGEGFEINASQKVIVKASEDLIYLNVIDEIK